MQRSHFIKKIKYSYRETASSDASCTLQDVDDEDEFENSSLQTILMSMVIQKRTLGKL
jgi:hypothetical protein